MRGYSLARRAAVERAHAPVPPCCYSRDASAPGQCSCAPGMRAPEQRRAGVMLHAFAPLVHGLLLAHMGAQQAIQRAYEMHAGCAVLRSCRPRGAACGGGRSGFWRDGLETGAARPPLAPACLCSVQAWEACGVWGQGGTAAASCQLVSPGVCWGVLLEERGQGALLEMAHTERGGVSCAPAHAGGSGCSVFFIRLACVWAGPQWAPRRPRLFSIQRLAAAAQQGAPRKRSDIKAVYLL
jgi:hypothetical protein